VIKIEETVPTACRYGQRWNPEMWLRGGTGSERHRARMHGDGKTLARRVSGGRTAPRGPTHTRTSPRGARGQRRSRAGRNRITSGTYLILDQKRDDLERDQLLELLSCCAT